MSKKNNTQPRKTQIPTYINQGNVRTGNKLINGVKIVEESVSVHLHFGGLYGQSSLALENLLHLCDGYMNFKDYNIPYSYVRIEIDPVETTNTNGLLKVDSLGIEGIEDYFSGNMNMLLNGNPDYLYVDMSVGSGPLDRLKEYRDRKLIMKLNQYSGYPINVVLEMTIFYFYVPSIRAKRVADINLLGKVVDKELILMQLKNSDNSIKKDNILEQNNPLKVGDVVNLMDQYSTVLVTVQIETITKTYYPNDTITFCIDNLPSNAIYIKGSVKYCGEENCQYHGTNSHPIRNEWQTKPK
jgi:hypothetical protein